MNDLFRSVMPIGAALYLLTHLRSYDALTENSVDLYSDLSACSPRCYADRGFLEVATLMLAERVNCRLTVYLRRGIILIASSMLGGEWGGVYGGIALLLHVLQLDSLKSP